MNQVQNNVLAYQQFPLALQNQLHNTNPISRLNREIKRRTDAVGVFPNVDSILRASWSFCSRSKTTSGQTKNYLVPGTIRQIVTGA